MAIRDLERLLASMEPVLWPGEYGYACVDDLPAGVAIFATVAEEEGMTLVALAADLAAAGIAHQSGWARISLTVNSDLAAVGLTAAIAGVLAEKGISANVIAGFHHDHFFVQVGRAEEAVAAMLGLAVWVSHGDARSERLEAPQPIAEKTLPPGWFSGPAHP